MTSTDSGFTAVTGASQYLIMPKHMSKELLRFLFLHTLFFFEPYFEPYLIGTTIS